MNILQRRRFALRPLSACAAGILLACLISGADLAARQPETRQPAAPGVQGPVERPVRPHVDAQQTRQAFTELLREHPPSVGQVMKLDPSLMRSESYLETYPALRAFLAEHPEVPQNAGYYLEHVHGVGGWESFTPQQRMAQDLLGFVTGFGAAAIIVGTLIWLVRTGLEQRRWNRLSRIQAEVHTKLMDRFSSNDELLAYVQTPSGRRFLESGPSPLPESTPAMSAPLSRILWSVQIGAVILVGGLGMLFLSGRTVPDLRELFFVLGCLGTALGVGFVVSAGASYVLSRRLGLLERPAQNHA